MRIVILLAPLIAVGCSRTPQVEGPLQVKVPDGWSLQYDPAKGTHLYVLTSTDHGLMMFSMCPTPSRPEELPALVRDQAESVVAAPESGALRLTSKEINIESFSGKEFSGTYVRFEAVKGTDRMCWSVFMMTDGANAWGGQFTGKTNDWSSAFQFLRALQKK